MLADRCEIGVAWEESGRGHLMRASKRDVEAFCDALVEAACLPGFGPDACFALGMACALDALACGRLDLSDPVGAAVACWADAQTDAGDAPAVTDAVRRYWDRGGR